MLNLAKKDFLVISSNKNELLELLLMPVLLISILGFALSGFMSGDVPVTRFNLGIVNEQSTTENLERLERTLEDESIPEQFINEMTTTAQNNSPATVLTELFEHEDFEEYITVEDFTSREEAEAALNREDIYGYIVIPEEFDYNYWRATYLDESSSAELEVSVISEDSISGTIIQSIVDSFADEYNLNTSIGIATEGEAEFSEDTTVHGELLQLSIEKPINSFQYYTIGMGVMFALYVAPAIASRSYREKQKHVFARIMLSGTRPVTYLLSKLISGTLISFVQLLILFTFSTIVFGTFNGRDANTWLAILFTTGLYSLLVGSLSGLLTSTSLYANNTRTAGIFSSIISVFSFLGGSFTPVSQFSESLVEVGNWTPNGATMTAYLQILQGFEIQEVMPLLGRIIAMTMIFIIVAVVIFPKRRLD